MISISYITEENHTLSSTLGKSFVPMLFSNRHPFRSLFVPLLYYDRHRFTISYMRTVIQSLFSSLGRSLFVPLLYYDRHRFTISYLWTVILSLFFSLGKSLFVPTPFVKPISCWKGPSNQTKLSWSIHLYLKSVYLCEILLIILPDHSEDAFPQNYTEFWTWKLTLNIMSFVMYRILV